MDTTTDFEQLVEKESRGLLAAVYAIVGDQHRSEEIVQEAFERGYRRWRRVSRRDRPGAWVRRVALNEAISTTRRRASEQRALARVDGLADRPAGPDPLAALDDDGVWAEVRPRSGVLRVHTDRQPPDGTELLLPLRWRSRRER